MLAKHYLWSEPIFFLIQNLGLKKITWFPTLHAFSSFCVFHFFLSMSLFHVFYLVSLVLSCAYIFVILFLSVLFSIFTSILFFYVMSSGGLYVIFPEWYILIHSSPVPKNLTHLIRASLAAT